MCALTYNSEDIATYLTDQRKVEILQLFNSQNHSICAEIIVCSREDFRDSDGYTNGVGGPYARYEQGKHIIKINKDEIASKLNDMLDFFFRHCPPGITLQRIREELFSFVDLCVLHECVHASQQQERGLVMQRGNLNLESDAYRQSRGIFEANYARISDQVRMRILEEYDRDHRNNLIT